MVQEGNVGKDVNETLEARRSVEIRLREELGDTENEVGFREKTFHGNKVLGKGGRSLDMWCIGAERQTKEVTALPSLNPFSSHTL